MMYTANTRKKNVLQVFIFLLISTAAVFPIIRLRLDVKYCKCQSSNIHELYFLYIHIHIIQGRISCEFDIDHITSNDRVGENLRFFQKLVSENRIRYTRIAMETRIWRVYTKRVSTL